MKLSAITLSKGCELINIWYIILALLIFGFLIFIHEFGHFTMARLFKVTIEEFAIGMGPTLVSKKSKKSGIKYSLRALPIGGFVSMEGEDSESQDENAFTNKPVWQRIIITCAGLRLGDKIIKVDGTRVHIANETIYEIMRKGINPIDITVIRDGETITLEDCVFPTIVEGGTRYGNMDFKVIPEAKTPLNVLKHAYFRSASTIKMIWESLYDLVTGRYGAESISGPIGVTKALGEAAEQGVGDLVYLTVVISMNLGVMNLLPLPALDGGRLLFEIIELIRRKPIRREIEGYIHFAGLVMLMLLMVVIGIKDIIGLF